MRDLKWEGLVVLGVFLIGLVALGIVTANKYDLGPFAQDATPTPEVTSVPTPGTSVILIDYGRLTVPVPGLRIEEPAGALIIYVKDADYETAIGALDPVALLVIEPGDAWVYYFDTLSNATIWFIIRCNPADMNLPAGERRCQTSQMNPGASVSVSYLYEHGFVSAQD
jgi:hypothetical protein